MTVREVGERAGVAPSLVTMLEKGQRNPTLSTLEAVAMAVGLQIDVLAEEDASALQAVSAMAELAEEDRLLAGRVLRGLPRLSQTFRDMLGLMLTQLEAEEAKRRTG